jgi:peptidylprolyl isomerase
MSGKKNNRQRQRRQQAAREARARALASRQRQEKKKRTAAVVGVLFLAAILLLAIALNKSDSGTKVSTSSSTTTPPSTDITPPTEPGAQSAAGKPCVAMAGPPPTGAPAVPVKAGPPPTKLVIEDLKPGTGAEVPKGATVTVNYIGVSCSSGATFDFSYGKQPATFPLSNVIPGWQEGIPGMKVGGQRLLGIPSEMAYGPSGRPPQILGDEALWFVIDLIETKAA